MYFVYYSANVHLNAKFLKRAILSKKSEDYRFRDLLTMIILAIKAIPRSFSPDTVIGMTGITDRHDRIQRST